MNDFETRLRASLDRTAQRAPVPSPIEGGTMKRIRMRRGMKAAALGVAAVLAITGVATAIRLGDRNTPPPANHGENVGPYTHWLYVLDPKNLDAHTQVLALDPATEEVVQTYPAGYDPQMALSPDGSRLYVTSSVAPKGINSFSSVIDVFDTSSGERLERASLPELNGTYAGRTLHKGPVFNPDFTTSLDGSRIYLGESTVRRGPVRATARVGTFDTSSNELLPNSVELRDCNTRILLPGPSPQSLTAACSATSNHVTVPRRNFLYFLTIDDDGSATPHRLDLPDSDEAGRFYDNLAWAASSLDGKTIYAVTGDGHVFVIDAARAQLVQEADLDVQPGFGVQMPKVLISADSATLYVGIGFATGSIVDARTIAAYDVRTWEEIGRVETDFDFFGLALGPDGTDLYAPTWRSPGDEKTSVLQVFDARTLEPTGTIGGVGQTPALVEVPRLGR